MKNYSSGIILIVVGVIFLLDTVGIVRAGDLFGEYWPLALISVGVSILLKGGRSTTPN